MIKQTGGLYQLELVRENIDRQFVVTLHTSYSNYTHITKIGNISKKESTMRVNINFLEKVMFYPSFHGDYCSSDCNKYMSLTDFRLEFFFVEDKHDTDQLKKMQEIMINKYNEIITSLCINKHDVILLDVQTDEDPCWNVWGENLEKRIV